jgi:hypothetical protein
VAVFNRTTVNNIKNKLGLSYGTPAFDWISSNHAKADQLNNFIDANTVNDVLDTEAKAFGLAALSAWMNDGSVDLEEMFIETSTPDDNYVYQGSKTLISNPLVLSNGDKVQVTFDITKSDNKSSNQQVATILIDGIKFALEEANGKLGANNKITSIHVFCTTNGKHSPTSNHSKGTAVDISRINNKKMAISGTTGQIEELQKAMNKFKFVRENFGPYFKHKYSKENNNWNYNYPVGGHTDLIHFSVRN